MFAERGLGLQKIFGLKMPGMGRLRTVCARVASKMPRVLASLLIACSLVSPGMAPPVEAAGQTRTLKIYFIHTKEKASITFKRNGRYDKKGLQQINRMLRDWRRNEPTNMDPRLLDLVWEVYQKSGSRDYIHVVSAYRSPATNGMLRSRSKGVAKKSQHMLGKAMDFYIPDVKLKTLREIGMKFQVGGVGYYPTSGSPFVHMDVGGVRAWPRMNRNELARLFPDGKTIHLPSDGKPLPGYQTAMADYKRRVGASAIEVAGGGTKGAGDVEKKRKGNFFAALFGGGGDEDEEPNAIASGADAEGVEEAPAVKSRPVVEEQPVLVAAQEDNVKAPVPAIRPAFATTPVADTPVDGGMEVALVAPAKNAAQDALAAALPETPVVESEYADLSAYKIPVPEILGKRGANGDAVAELLTAEANPDLANALGEDGDTLAFVPVPALRPGGEALAGDDALNAVAQADVAVPTLAERSLTTAVAVAGEPADVAAAAETKVALAAPTAVLDDPLPQPVEMAAFVPQSGDQARADLFGTVFDGETEMPLKGKRPKKQEAEAATNKSIRTEPKLTKQIISEWALTNGRMATLSKPVKAPRFVSKSLRAAPTTVYSAGFSSPAGAVDTARFTGTAVNFLEVQKFSTN